MRFPFGLPLPLLLLLPALGGCVGHLADFVGPAPQVVAPQLLRFGYDLDETRCVGGRLAATLRIHRLRDLATAAAAVRRGYYDPQRLTPRDLMWVATSLSRRPEIRGALEGANLACGVSTAPPPPVVAVPPVPQAAPAEWLNLGRAESGQSIAIDAASIEQAETTRTAWFRMTDPGASAPSPDICHLIVDCGARTINATERRRLDADGNVTETRAYPDNPLPVEQGTVMQIAWMSLCT
jgi:hypothetical protein